MLKQYCDDQSASNKNDVDFPDLLSIWSFAAQSNAESLLSAIPAALAQFFRTISSELDFREFGISLCHSLLKRDQLRLIDGGLSAPKFKEHLISPCLRLLTEIVSFDAGTLSGNVFSRRDTLFRRLDALLDNVPSQQESSDRRRPTVRRNAQRLLLALLKYLDADSKAELVSQGKTLHSCIRRLLLDGGDIVRDLLDSFRLHLIETSLPKQIKGRFLNTGNLNQLAALYDYEPEDIDTEKDSAQTLSVREAAHNFLLQLCTTRSGTLLQQAGWYPAGFESEISTKKDDDIIDLGLDSPYYFDEYNTAVPVKNSTSSSFLQSLRPDRDTLQTELVITVFQAAPELVADYFTKRPKLPPTRRDEATWRGQFAFIFSVVNLPIPQNYGWHNATPFVPPPLSIVVESILPRPMDRPTTTQCLKSNDEVTVMSIARLMAKVLAKLDKVQKAFRTVASSPDVWNQASQKLGELVALRAPTYHNIVTALQKTDRDQVLVRQAILECMAMYHKILPMSTAGSKFDVGPRLTEVVDQLLTGQPEGSDQEEDLSSQVVSLAAIAGLSRAMKWWHKPKPDQLCPLLSMIKAYMTNEFLRADSTVKKVIYDVLHRSGSVCPEDYAVDAIVSSLDLREDGDLNVSQPQQVYLFAESCMIRTSKQPVKYLDQLEIAQRDSGDDSPLSLLPVCVAEQWSYILKTSNPTTTNELSIWVARLFAKLQTVGENESVLSDYLRKQMLNQSTKEAERVLLDAFTYQDEQPKRLSQLSKGRPAKQDSEIPTEGKRETGTLATPRHSDTIPMSGSSAAIDLTSIFPPPSPRPSSLKGLTSWGNPDFESELSPPILTSRIARLIHCLSSSLEEVRLQAQQTLQGVMHALSDSTYDEKDQVYLLLGELCETARQHALTASSPPQHPPRQRLTNGETSKQRERDPALPSVVTSLATLLLSILTNPADKMYSKTNRFLMLGPTWTPVTKAIPYWVDQILLREPEADEPYAWEVEVSRLLDVLVSGLRTEQDLDVYRKSNVFERLGSLYVSSALAGKMGMRKKILHVLANTMEVEGGADTLITRVGVRSWLEMVGAREGRESELGKIVEALKGRLEERCSEGYIRQWEEDRPVFKERKGKE